LVFAELNHFLIWLLFLFVPLVVSQSSSFKFAGSSLCSNVDFSSRFLARFAQAKKLFLHPKGGMFLCFIKTVFLKGRIFCISVFLKGRIFCKERTCLCKETV